MKGKTYAFIDASNIIYGAKEEGWFIDQKKLLIYLKKKFKVSSGFFCSMYSYGQRRQFYSWHFNSILQKSKIAYEKSNVLKN